MKDMKRKRITKSKKHKATRFIQRNIKNKTVSFILVAFIAFGFYYYNEIYLNSLETAIVYNKDYQKISCVDGDTFKLDDTYIRLLAIDTPETVKPNHPEEPFSKEASTLTCDLIIHADDITLKQDTGNEIDKYGRTLAWVYVDDVLLQEIILEKGYGEIKYVHKPSVDKSILSKLKTAEKNAKAQNLGIWEN